MQDDQPVKPANILNIVATNQGRRPITRGIPKAKPLSVVEVKALIAEGHIVVDGRSSASYGAGHIAGAINVQQSSDEFEQRVGWVVPDNSHIILVTDSAAAAQKAIYNMAFIALDQFVTGYLEGGIDAWMNAGEPVETVGQMDVFTLNRKLSTNGLKVLDVRASDEWNDGHIENAHFMPYTSMAQQLSIPSQLDKLDIPLDQAVAVTCATGKRSSTAISLMLRHGYKNLYNVTGGMKAWGNAGLKMLDGEGYVINEA